MKKNLNLFLILALGFILRIFLSQYVTYESDFNFWTDWASGVNEVGFDQFYDKYWCDYMPGYIYVLWLLQKIQLTFPELPEKIIFKLPANLADLCISIVIYTTLKKITTHKNSILASIAYFFNPASMSNSTLWGQVDSFQVLPLLISVLLGLSRYFTASVVFALISFMIKPQGLVIIPILCFLIIRDIYLRRKEEGVVFDTYILAIRIFASIAFTILIFTLPYVWSELDNNGLLNFFKQPIYFIQDRFLTAYNGEGYTSANAFNFWAMIHGFWLYDHIKFINITYQIWGTIIFGLFYALIIIFLIRREVTVKSNELREFSFAIFVASTLIFFALFLFATRVHERHFLPAIVFSTLIVFHSSLYWFLYFIISVCYVINMYYAYTVVYPIELFPFQYISPPMVEDIMPIMAIILIAVFLFVLIDFIKDTKRFNKRKTVTF